MTVPNEVFFPDVLQFIDAEPVIPVKGFSMLPFIRGGKDLVVLEKATGPVRRDDIVLFYIPTRQGRRYVMHRVLSAEDGRLDIMGDGVPKNHEHVSETQVLARVKWILRGGDGKVPQGVFVYSDLPKGVRRVDPYAPAEIRKVRFWQALLPFRRYLLFAYRHLPWNRRWLRKNL